MLNFDAETHTYTTEEGLVVPGVTDILGDLNIRKTGVYPPGAAERGKRKHSLLEYHDKGTLDYDSLIDGDLEIITAWTTAMAELGVSEWTGIEEVVFSQSSWYAGTLDRRTDEMVVDIKSGAEEDWHVLQIAAYAYAIGVRTGAIVYLKSGKIHRIDEKEMDELVQDWGHIRKSWKWVA